MPRENIVKLQVRLPTDVHQWVSAQAQRYQSSINAEIIRCIRDAMDRQAARHAPGQGGAS